MPSQHTHFYFQSCSSTYVLGAGCQDKVPDRSYSTANYVLVLCQTPRSNLITLSGFRPYINHDCSFWFFRGRVVVPDDFYVGWIICVNWSKATSFLLQPTSLPAVNTQSLNIKTACKVKLTPPPHIRLACVVQPRTFNLCTWADRMCLGKLVKCVSHLLQCYLSQKVIFLLQIYWPPISLIKPLIRLSISLIILYKPLIRLNRPRTRLFRQPMRLIRQSTRLFRPLIILIRQLNRLIRPTNRLIRPLIRLNKTMIRLIGPTTILIRPPIRLFIPQIILIRPLFRQITLFYQGLD